MIRMRIRELIQTKGQREGRQLTQKEVARETGIDESLLSRYANGFTSSFKGEVIEKMMDYFQVTMDELFERENKLQAEIASGDNSANRTGS